MKSNWQNLIKNIIQIVTGFVNIPRYFRRKKSVSPAAAGIRRFSDRKKRIFAPGAPSLPAENLCPDFWGVLQYVKNACKKRLDQDASFLVLRPCRQKHRLPEKVCRRTTNSSAGQRLSNNYALIVDRRAAGVCQALGQLCLPSGGRRKNPAPPDFLTICHSVQDFQSIYLSEKHASGRQSERPIRTLFMPSV